MRYSRVLFFSWYHLLNRLSFDKYMCRHLCKDQVGAADWVYFWALYSIPFVYLSTFVPAPHWVHRCGLYIFILRSGTVLAAAMLSLRVILTSQDFLCFHPNFKILFLALKRTSLELDGDCVDLSCFYQHRNFHIFNPKKLWTWDAFHLLGSSILFLGVLKFQQQTFSPLWLAFTLWYFKLHGQVFLDFFFSKFFIVMQKIII